MENESNFPLGGAINLHTLLALPIFVGGKNHFESILLPSQSFYKTFIPQRTGKTKKISRDFLLAYNTSC